MTVQWDRAWLAVMIAWWLIGLAGLTLSVASLRVARAKRRTIPNNRPMLKTAAIHVVRSAWSRLVLFGFLMIDAPLIYAMFDVPDTAGIHDRIRIVAPLGAVFGSAVLLVTAGAVVLALLIADTRDLLPKDLRR